ncbi:hypothetical protein Bca52824_075823 [Brassica carinata]|uniref:DUF4283 domain-containing protein n=1 Tax=Brassica carinata TaxID=52824 RepID=A0A8X7TWQ4_BRACI|nr:hypothetical protein Bca52824_075823 [Brassica carinata]
MASQVSDPSICKPPSVSPKVSDEEVRAYDSQTEVKLQIPSTPTAIPASSVPSYVERFKASLRNLRKISNPTFLEDGTPVVQAPHAILLQASEMWKDHLVAHFHGRRPHPTKIIADLNPVWGKFGNITVRTLSNTSCLIFIPSIQTREWVLQVGYWQVDHCGFSVSKWSAVENLQVEELRTAPTWVVLKNIPPQLYSLDGISVVASAIGEPLHTEKSRLDPYHFGDTKVKFEITLDNDPPKVVEVRDVQGNAVRVRVEYPSLPPKCLNCEKYGHLINRCLKPMVKRKKVQAQVSPNQDRVVSTSTKINLISGLVEAQHSERVELEDQEQMPQTTHSEFQKKSKKKKKKSKKPGKSLPPGTSEASSYSTALVVEVGSEEVPIQEIAPAEVPFTPATAYQLVSEGSGKVGEVEDHCGKTEVSESEFSLEEEVQEEEIQSSEGVDPEEDNTLWFKHPKAVRRALRQEALWKASLLKKPPKDDFSLRTRGFSSGKKSPL